MANAIILHGMPSKNEYYNADYPSASNSHWVPWIQKQLLTHEIDAATPEVPHAYQPNYDVWAKEFERFTIDQSTILVGHSCGGGFLVRWLSEHPEVTVNKVILVAPWTDPFREDTTDFFEFTIDQSLASRTQGLWIFNSDTDSKGVHATVDSIRSSVDDVKYKEFHDYGHFTLKGMGTIAFPELLDVLIS